MRALLAGKLHAPEKTGRPRVFFSSEGWRHTYVVYQDGQLLTEGFIAGDLPPFSEYRNAVMEKLRERYDRLIA